MVSGDRRDASEATTYTPEFREEFSAQAVKIDALTIVISAPLWPPRDRLNHWGQTLYDLMADTAKPLALAAVENRFSDAMKIAATWTAPVTAFIENTYVKGDEQAQKLLRVYRHYLDATASWGGL